MSLPEVLRAGLAASNLTVAAAAQKAGVSERTFYRWLAGEAEPQGRRLRHKLARHLHIDPTELGL